MIKPYIHKSWARTVWRTEVVQPGGLTDRMQMHFGRGVKCHSVLIEFQINVNQGQNGEGLDKWG